MENKTLKKVYLTEIRDELIELNKTLSDEPLEYDDDYDGYTDYTEAEASEKLDDIIRRINNLLKK